MPRFIRAVLGAPLLVLPLLAGAPGAYAQSAEQVQAVRTACEADVKKFCAGIQPGGGRLVQCLKTNQEQLNPPCKASFAALTAAAKK